MTGNVACQGCPIPAIRIQPFKREETAFRQCRIHRRCTVPLAEYEAISLKPIRVRWVYPHNPAVENREQIGHREARTDVRGFRAMYHSQRVGANVLG